MRFSPTVEPYTPNLRALKRLLLLHCVFREANMATEHSGDNAYDSPTFLAKWQLYCRGPSQFHPNRYMTPFEALDGLISH